MSESFTNIRPVCNEHAPKPKPELFKNINLTDLIGKYVKIAFKADRPGVDKEHMWVKVTLIDIKTGMITGNLNNDPVSCSYIKDGDVVHFKKEQIEDIDHD